MSLDPANPLADAIATLAVAAMTAIAGTVGGMINAWLARRKQRAKDLSAAVEKIRDLYKRLGVEKCPSEIQTLDDVHRAIREIYARLEVKAP